jgi:hypothetical protein
VQPINGRLSVVKLLTLTAPLVKLLTLTAPLAILMAVLGIVNPAYSLASSRIIQHKLLFSLHLIRVRLESNADEYITGWEVL